MSISTGSIVPLGDGAVGKTVLTKILSTPDLTEEVLSNILQTTKKTVNMEMEFIQLGKFTDTDQNVSAQLYTFPGQRQKYKEVAPSFEEILSIFEFMPGLQNIEVLLLVHDTSRIESLKSLESWLSVAIEKNWLTENSLIILISNKIDLQPANLDFNSRVLDGIYNMVSETGLTFDRQTNLISINTSCATLEGIDELKSVIANWIANHGKSLKR